MVFGNLVDEPGLRRRGLGPHRGLRDGVCVGGRRLWEAGLALLEQLCADRFVPRPPVDNIGTDVEYVQTVI